MSGSPSHALAASKRARSATEGSRRPDASVGRSTLMEAAGNQAVSSMLSGSAPLNPEARRGLERAYGVDLGRVRLHTGPEARQTARSEQALAFTRGDDIFLGDAKPEVLAHELAHAVQQARGATTLGRPAPAEALEAEAESAAVSGGEISAAPHGVTQRLFGLFEDEEAKKQPDPEIQRRLLDELTIDKDAWKRHLDDPGAEILRSHSYIQHIYKDDPDFQKWMADPSYRPAAAPAPVAVQPATPPAESGPRDPVNEAPGPQYTYLDGSPVQGPVTPLPSEVSIPVVKPAPPTQQRLRPPIRKKPEPTPEENAKAAYFARTTLRQRAEDAERAPPRTFIGQHEQALLDLESYYESVPFVGPAVPLVQALTGEDILGRPVDRWKAAGTAAMGIGMEVAPELLGPVGEAGGLVNPAVPEIAPGLGPLEETISVAPKLGPLEPGMTPPQIEPSPAGTPLAPPPVANPPIAEPPVAEAPVAEPPVAKAPVAEPPAPEPAVTEPSASEPATTGEAAPSPAPSVARQPSAEAVKIAETTETTRVIKEKYGHLGIRDISDPSKAVNKGGPDRLFVIGSGNDVVLLEVDAKLSIQESPATISEVSSFQTQARTGGAGRRELLDAARAKGRIAEAEFESLKNSIESGLVQEEVVGVGSVKGISEGLGREGVTYSQGEQFAHVQERVAAQQQRKMSLRLRETILKPPADKRTARTIANEIWDEFSKVFSP